ncbi:MAG: hypothetical protein JWM85_132, partial [Acidimicrobiaceae bacterium]|nr:hypothetical protein [Acidimicrobiaceae bacterium]
FGPEYEARAVEDLRERAVNLLPHGSGATQEVIKGYVSQCAYSSMNESKSRM